MLRSLTASLLLVTSVHAAEPARTVPVIDFNTCAKPVWPMEALRKQQTGKVVLGFLVGADGAVMDSKVLTSSGYELLDEAARSAIRQCRFRPGSVNGVPQEAWQMVQYVWTLDTAVTAPRTNVASPYRERALTGDRDALFALAQDYGKGTADEVNDISRMTQALAQSPAAAQYELAGRLFQGRGAPTNQREALVWYQLAANAGYAAAQERVGVFYLNGSAGLLQDSTAALAWLLKAAAQGNHDAENDLGAMYHNARGVPRDYAKAAEWYRRGVEGGNTWSQANLGRLYLHGWGVNKDPAEALRLLRLAADRNNHAAELDLAMMSFNGVGVPADDQEGNRWLRLAAIGGDTTAQLRLASALTYGVRMPVDQDQAVGWLRKTAARGNAAGLNNLGYAYEIGRGVEQNYVAARVWYAQAVSKENGAAEAALGALYQQGLGGDQNLAKAVELYQAAIRHNNADGMTRMAALQESGEGAHQNPAGALELYQRAAGLNYEKAMRRLASAYQNGELGLQADAVKADEWRGKADARAAKPVDPFQL